MECFPPIQTHLSLLQAAKVDREPPSITQAIKQHGVSSRVPGISLMGAPTMTAFHKPSEELHPVEARAMRRATDKLLMTPLCESVATVHRTALTSGILLVALVLKFSVDLLTQHSEDTTPIDAPELVCGHAETRFNPLWLHNVPSSWVHSSIKARWPASALPVD